MGRRRSDQPGYDELIEQIVGDYRLGESRRSISQKYGIAVPTVRDWLVRKGEPLRSGAEQSRKHNQENSHLRQKPMDEQTLRHLYCELGWSSGRCSSVFGVDSSTVRDRIKALGIERTREQKELAQINANEIRKETCQELFGGVSPNADPEVRAKTVSTNLDRYGHANPFGNKDIQEKIKSTNLDLYGVENPLHDPERAAQIGAAVSAAAQSKWSEEARIVLSSRETMLDYMKRSGRKTVPLMGSGLGVSAETLYKRLTAFSLWEELDTSYHTSAWEREVGDIIRSWGISTDKAKGILLGQSKRGQDIDWYSSEHSIGIECNGSLNHSEARKEDRNYHIKKTKSAEAQGIFLYHIFSYEWANPRQRPILESQLRNRFGLADRRIGARKCRVVAVSPEDSTAFLEENHLQGRVGARVRIGLLYGDELVSLMTFSHPREQKKGDSVEWELIRYAVKRNTAVQGGANKLFGHFIKSYSPKSIVSYSDVAKTTGKMYSLLGFELVNQTVPEYVWWKSEKKVLRRYQCMAHKLKAKYANEIPGIESMSEAQIMHYLGYSRIYGCGNKVWVWRDCQKTSVST